MVFSRRKLPATLPVKKQTHTSGKENRCFVASCLITAGSGEQESKGDGRKESELPFMSWKVLVEISLQKKYL